MSAEGRSRSRIENRSLDHFGKDLVRSAELVSPASEEELVLGHQLVVTNLLGGSQIDKNPFLGELGNMFLAGERCRTFAVDGRTDEITEPVVSAISPFRCRAQAQTERSVHFVRNGAIGPGRQVMDFIYDQQTEAIEPA